MALTLTIPSRILEPGGSTIQTPWGPVTSAPASETDPTVVITLDDTNSAALASFIAAAIGSTATPAPITVDAVAKTLTQAQILQALQERIAAGGN